MAIPDYAKLSKSLFGKETVTVPKDKWEQKHISANEKDYLQRATAEFIKAWKAPERQQSHDWDMER